MGSNHTDLNLDCIVAMKIRTGIPVGNDWTLCDTRTWSAGIQDLWSGVRSSCIPLEPLCMKRTSSPSQLREEEGVEHHGVILPSDVILKHERPYQALRGNRITHQDFLGMQSGFVNLM